MTLLLINVVVLQLVLEPLVYHLACSSKFMYHCKKK